MHYAAFGDSISIDDYTEVKGGGAASQLARLLHAAPFQDLTRDGNVTSAVLLDLKRLEGRPDVATLTIGGNNLLVGEEASTILPQVDAITRELVSRCGRVILNTIYDPTDGNDALGEAHGLEPELRGRLREVNEGIIQIADRHGCLLSDLEALFHGHGIASPDSWFVMTIEPNLAGATAIATHWNRLLAGGI